MRGWMLVLAVCLACSCKSEPPAAPAGTTQEAPGPGGATQGGGPGPAGPVEGKPAPEVDPESTLTPEEKAAFELLKEAGPRHLAAVLVWPARWKDAVSLVAPVVDALPLKQGVREALRPGSTPLAALAALLGLELPDKLEGWDTDKPILLALGGVDPLFSSPAEVLSLSLSLKDRSVPGLRHRILVPATDAVKLTAELQALLVKTGMSAGASGVALPKDAVLLHTPNMDVVVIVPESGRVRIELLAAPSVTESMAAGNIPAPDIEALLRLDRSELVLTPAVRQAVAPGQLAAVLLRGSMFRSFAAQVTARVIADVIPMASPEMRETLAGRGTAEMLSGWGLMSPAFAAVDLVAFGLVPGESITVTGIVELTAEGKRLSGLAAGTGWPMAAAAGKPAGARFSTALDLGTALRDAKRPPLLAGEEPSSHLEAIRLVQECGHFCLLHAGLFSWQIVPSILARTPLALPLTGTVQDLLPRSLSAAVVAADDGGPLPGVALAAFYPKGTDLGRLQEAARLAGIALGVEIPLSHQETADGLWVFAGFKTQPEKAFDISGAPRPGVAALAELNPSLLADYLRPLEPNAASFAALLPRMSVESMLMDGFVMTRLQLHFKEGGTAAPLVAPVARPVVLEAYADDSVCADRLLAEVRSLLMALSIADPAERAALIGKGIEALDKLSSCAPDNTEFKKQCDGVKAALGRYLNNAKSAGGAS